MFKKGSGGGFYLDDLLYGIGYFIGKLILIVAGLATGYIGGNIVIGLLRWFIGVVF